MSRKRKQYSTDFKAKAAFAAVKGAQTTAELAARFETHPTLVSRYRQPSGSRHPFDQLMNKTG